MLIPRQSFPLMTGPDDLWPQHGRWLHGGVGRPADRTLHRGLPGAAAARQPRATTGMEGCHDNQYTVARTPYLDPC